MIYFLFFLTGILLLISWTSNNGNIFSVSVILTGISFILIGVGISSMSFYGISDISTKTAIVFFGALVFMCLGEAFGKRVRVGRDIANTYEYENNQPIYLDVSKWVAIISFLLGIVMAYFSYVDFMRIASSCGVNGDIIQVFTSMRLLTIRSGVSLEKSLFLSQGCILAECLAYFCFYYFEHQLVFYKEKHFLFVLPIFPLLAVQLLSTNRTYFIQLFVIIACIMATMEKAKKNWASKGDGKILKKAIIFIILLVALFRASGLLTGKTQDIGFLENIYKYSSDSLFCFDTFIKSQPYSYSESFGYYTLGTLYRLINNFLGTEIPFYSGFAPFLNVGNSSVTDNIITGYYFPILDYGILGMLLRQFLIGTFCAVYIRLVKEKRQDRNNFIRVIFLGIIMYPVCMQFIADSFGLLLNIKMLYYYVYLRIITFVFIEKRVRWISFKKKGV